MTRTGEQATAFARRQIKDRQRDWTALCLMFVRVCYGLPARFPTARAAWEGADTRHETSDPNAIPAGVPVFWRVGEFWHVALSIGRGKCISTDVRRRGWPDVVKIAAIGPAWGAQLLGWTEDLNGFVVYTQNTSEVTSTRVTHARAKLRAARVAIGQAQDLLDNTPDEREQVHAVAGQLDRIIDAIGHKLGRLPKR